MKKQMIFVILGAILNGFIMGASGIPLFSWVGAIIFGWMTFLVVGYANFLWRN